MDDLDALLADLQTNLNKSEGHPAAPLHHHTTTHHATTLITNNQPTTTQTELVRTIVTDQQHQNNQFNHHHNNRTTRDQLPQSQPYSQPQSQPYSPPQSQPYSQPQSQLQSQPYSPPQSQPQSQHIYQNDDYTTKVNSTQVENYHNGFYHTDPTTSRPSSKEVLPSTTQHNHTTQPHNHTPTTSTTTVYQNVPSKEQMYRHEMREEVRTETRSSGPSIATPLASQQQPSMSNNLSELDSLLYDLNTSKQNTALHKESSVVVQNGASRPSVDSLLDELNSVGHRETVEQRAYKQHYETSHAPPPPPAPTPLLPCQPRVTHVSHVSASNATKELDDLMESLSDFKINASTLQSINNQSDTAYAKPIPKRRSPSPPPPPKPQPPPMPQTQPAQPTQPVAKPTPPPNQLDSMLGSLTSHMTEQGINTAQKGCCCACDKPIVGQVITALGKTWHPEHFTCTHCKEELGTKNFFERDGKPYCEPDYHNLFSPKCSYCSGPILDKCVTAMNTTWHPEHFFCAQCGNTFGEEGFHEKNGKPYCKEDYFNMFAPKCGGCNSPIMENYISALNGQWHPECFVCRDCNEKFNGGSFFDHEGLPYCETHYHAKRGSLCAACNKPITGRCITAMFRKYHPEHFLCAFCLQQLNKGTFKEQNNKPYCHTCFDKLYG